jgi:hypothetical protein
MIDDPLVECPTCIAADRDCPRCGGTGEIPFSELTDDEKEALGLLSNGCIFTQQHNFTD